MAELGVIASIIGIASVGVKLSKSLYVSGEKAVSADHNINRIATNVSLFSASLKHFASVLESNQELCSIEAEITAKQLISECSDVFQELSQMAVMARKRSDSGVSVNAPNDGRRRSSMLQKVKIYFEQPKVEYLLAQLEYLKTTLSILIQTLQLAAITAKAKKESDTISQTNNEKIEQERMHIETLIMARQLSVIILQQFNNSVTDDNTRSGRVSPSGSEESFEEVQAPKLLTESKTPATSLVRIGRGNLTFLDRVLPEQAENVPPVVLSSHNKIIDQLLGRWTKLPEMEMQINKSHRGAMQQMSKGSGLANVGFNGSKSRDLPTPTPELNLTPVESNEERKASSIPPPPTGPARPPKQQLSPRLTGRRSPSKSPPPLSTSLDPASSPMSPQASLQPPQPPHLNRALTSPEPMSPDQNHRRPTSPQPSEENQLVLPNSQTPRPSRPNTYRPTSPQLSRYASSPVPSNASMSNGSPPSGLPFPQSPRSSFASRGRNYSDASSLGSFSDSEFDEEERESRSGLGIPWRIVIGNKYWDFLDERLVGPRTPYLPTEPMSWLYSHDYAQTEISEKWVCEEAIRERGYAYTYVKAKDDTAAFPQGQDENRWRIQCTLYYRDVDALVERSVDIYRSKTSGQPSQSSVQQPIPDRSNPVPVPVPQPMPSIPMPTQPTMPNQGPQSPTVQEMNVAWGHMTGTPRGMKPPPQPLPNQARSVSFQDPPQIPRGAPRGPPPPGPGLGVNGFPPNTYAPNGNMPPPPPPPSSNNVRGPPPPVPNGHHWLPHPHLDPHFHHHRDKDRDREHRQRDRERGYDDYEDHDRPRSRGKDSTCGRSKDTNVNKGSKKKNKHSGHSTAGTLAKIGGMLAMLEGLDAL